MFERSPGMSTCCVEVLSQEVFEAYRDAGIKYMELSFYCGVFDSLEWDKIPEWSSLSGVTVRSIHLPFDTKYGYDISLLDDGLRRQTVAKQIGFMKNAARVGIKVAVVHPSGEPIDDGEREARMQASIRSLKELAEAAGRLNMTLAVENLPRTCLGKNSQEISRLLSADGSLRICFDTNHLLSQPFDEFLHDVGDKIAAIHVSDYNYSNERHWMPGEGAVDWQYMIKLLDESGYDGPFMYEVRFVPKPHWAIERPRPLTFSDFRRNFDELISGRQPTVLGEKRA